MDESLDQQKKEYEYCDVYSLDNRLLDYARDYGYFIEKILEEFELTGKISSKIATVREIIMNTHGKILITTRSDTKFDPRMKDKSIDGPIKIRFTPETSIVAENFNKLGLTTIVLRKNTLLDMVWKKTNLSKIAYAAQIGDEPNLISVKKTQDGKCINLPLINYTYLGVTDAPISFRDGEVRGMEYYTLQELKEEMILHPERFTQDITWMLNKYNDQIISILKALQGEQ